MKQISIVVFDDFTDIDLFLMWDILGRNTLDWSVKILGTEKQHRSAHGLLIDTHGDISEANNSDVVLFSSGKLGIPKVLDNSAWMQTFSLNPQVQIVGSICAGAFILAKLGLLDGAPATTHPDAKSELEKLGVRTLDKPLVCNGNVATAGGCLSATYLIGWVVETIFGPDKRRETLREILPAGQYELFEELITSSIHDGITTQNSLSPNVEAIRSTI